MISYNTIMSRSSSWTQSVILTNVIISGNLTVYILAHTGGIPLNNIIISCKSEDWTRRQW